MYPDVRAWFSSSDGNDPEALFTLLSEARQDQLEDQGGACIVYTHLGLAGFLSEEGSVHPRLRKVLAGLAKRNGWFVPATRVLDHLAAGRGVTQLTWPKRLRVLARKWLAHGVA